MKNNVGYLIAAYVGAAVLYAGYFLSLRKRERSLESRPPRG
jgi:hypothetical protein